MGTVEARNHLQITGQASVYSEKYKPKVMLVTGALYCEREYDRGAGCGKTARPDLYGGALGNWCSYHDF
jgi:hypothetical protein